MKMFAKTNILDVLSIKIEINVILAQFLNISFEENSCFVLLMLMQCEAVPAIIIGTVDE